MYNAVDSVLVVASVLQVENLPKAQRPQQALESTALYILDKSY